MAHALDQRSHGPSRPAHRESHPAAGLKAIRRALFHERLLLARDIDALSERLQYFEPFADEPHQAAADCERAKQVLLQERLQVRLRLIEQALARIDAGEFGICRTCGQAIPHERLRAHPVALCCVNCEVDEESGPLRLASE